MVQEPLGVVQRNLLARLFQHVQIQCKPRGVFVLLVEPDFLGGVIAIDFDANVVHDLLVELFGLSKAEEDPYLILVEDARELPS